MKTFGRIRRTAKQWAIECEPHVLLRLKRVFPRVSRRAHGEIKLQDTPEVCRELLWFMERYPLHSSDLGARLYLEEQAKRHLDLESLVEQLVSGLGKTSDYGLAIPAREYQKAAADIAIAQGGLLLTDELGLGKTCVGICIISRGDLRPALVVTMTHLTRQWEQEIHKFAPELRTHVLKKATPYDIGATVGKKRKGQLQLINPETPDVIITNYHKLNGWSDTLAGLVKSVVFDEAQELRRKDSDKYAAAKNIADKARCRISLTATPIYNYGDEIFNIGDVTMPGKLGSRTEFLEEWCTQANARSYKIQQPEVFGAYARANGIMLRRTRSDVGRELPSLTKVPHLIDSNPEELQRIHGSASELARKILSDTESSRGEHMRASEELSMLVRQATGIAKAPFVAEFVRMIAESGEKVLLFGWHRAVYDLWIEQLKELNPVLYTGSESGNQKEESKRKFLGDESNIMIMSLRSGAGIDGLQAVCSTCVYGELDYSPGVHEQDTGRIHRDGQLRPVVAYYLIAQDGSDPIMSELLGLKQAQADGLKNREGEMIAQLDQDGLHIKRLAMQYL
jgi:SNF2 family DNA or RNA helicase